MFHDVEQRSRPGRRLQCVHLFKIVVSNQRPPIVMQDSTPISIFIGAVDASRPVALGVTSIHHLIVIEAVGDAEYRHEFGDGCTLNDVIASPAWLDKATCCPAATVCACR